MTEQAWEVRLGECVEAMRAMPAESVDAVVCDPPYLLSFMGKNWDRPEMLGQSGAIRPGTDESGVTKRGFDHAAPPAAMQTWHESWAREALRVLKPGGHLVAFGGSRTYHRLASGVEDAGFEIRDQLQWLAGSGFPKSLNVGKAMDKGGLRCTCHAVPYDHGAAATEHDVQSSGVRSDDVPEAIDAGGERGGVLLPGVPKHGASPEGEAWTEPAAGGPAEPGVEGRRDPEAGEGELPRGALCQGPGVGAADGEGGRVHRGASAGDGGAGGLSADAGGVRAPRGPRSVEQRAGESVAVADERGAQGVGAWPRCGGCGLPVVPAADGMGSALKPAHEPIVLARKPLAGTVAGNVLAHGTGALNIDGARVQGVPERPGNVVPHVNGNGVTHGAMVRDPADYVPPSGRWPANVVLDEGAAAVLDEQAGPLTSGAAAVKRASGADAAGNTGAALGAESRPAGSHMVGYGDTGGASRFFKVAEWSPAEMEGERFRYVAKASRAEREAGLDGLPAQDGGAYANGAGMPGRTMVDGEWVQTGTWAEPNRQARANVHPTVKPVDVMRWLVRLVCPAGGLVLDPFNGSGSTGIAAVLEGRRYLGLEREAEYVAIAEARIAWWAAADVGLTTPVAMRSAARHAKARAGGQFGFWDDDENET